MAAPRVSEGMSRSNKALHIPTYVLLWQIRFLQNLLLLSAAVENANISPHQRPLEEEAIPALISKQNARKNMQNAL